MRLVYSILLTAFCGCLFAQNSQISLQSAEYFFGDVDPGIGNATPLAVLDGNWDEAVEEVFASINITTLDSVTVFNIRVQNHMNTNGGWSPLFKKILFFHIDTTYAPFSLQSAEYYFGNVDPGLGNANPLIVIDGNWDEAVESVFATINNVVSIGTQQTFNIRVQNHMSTNGGWSPLFKKILFFHTDTTYAPFSLQSAEYYFGNVDPGLGNANPLIVIDGNWDEASEIISGSIISSSLSNGINTFNIRVQNHKSTNGGWSPVFKKMLFYYYNLGCMDTLALNYDSAATVSDSSCIYPCTLNDVKIIINTADYGFEVSWDLTDSNGVIVASDSVYSSWSSDTTTVCLSDDCFTFNMYDSYGDGWNGGTYEILVGGISITTGGLSADTSFGFDKIQIGNSVFCPCASIPYFENFDSGTGTFTNTGWLLDAAGTPSVLTGPSDDMTGGGNYMYYETSTGYSPTVSMSTECLDISSLSDPCLKWNYHMYGATIGSLDVLVNGDTVWTLSGDQGNQWNDAQVPLSSYLGVDITVEFVASYGGSFTGDIAIDNIVVNECINLPSVVINNPLDGASFTTTNSVDVNFDITDFIVGTGSGDGHIHYYVNGSMTMKYDTLDISLTNLANGNHVVVIQLVDNAHQPFTSNIADTVSFSVNVIYGCTGPTSCNYNPLATIDDGSCYGVFGCMDSLAFNYDPNACIDDGSCLYCSSPGVITGINLTEIIHDRSIFNWDDMNSTCAIVDQIRIRYRELGTNSWSTKTMGSPVGNNAPCLNTSKLILNLSASTTYEYDFKIWYQDGTVVTWHENGSFTTLPLCDNVINIIPTPITTTKTQFCWDTVSTYAFVRLQYRENVPGSSFSNIGGMGVMSPTLCKDKNGLTPGLTYRVMWRTWCNPSGGPYRSAQWDGPVLWSQPTSIRVEGGTTINNLDVYPNPSRDIFNVSFTSEDVQDLDVRIINVIGEVVYTENLNKFVGEYTKQVDLSTYTKGVYFLEITTDNGVINKKLILQ